MLAGPLASPLLYALGCTPADRVRAQGVRLVFYNDESDILLLQQMSEIPRDFKPFFMGESSALKRKAARLLHVQCCQRCCGCN